ncbi:MAG: restriction endonuclease, partial [Candidatus Cloacimonetes bacterium]|nr:restriction endonuclease [Candidatus Cloacimonadota bacterium]
DVSFLSIDVIIKRFEKNGIKKGKDFLVRGVPKDVHSAVKLAESSPFQFEVWAVSQLNAMPTVKSGDKGVDGVINFLDYTRSDKMGKGIISVKGGHSINPAMVRELKGTISSQNADFGILITTEKPTKGMIEEAVKEGNFEYKYMQGVTQAVIPKIQLVTVEDLLSDPIKVKLPPTVIEPYKKPDIKKNPVKQGEIEF